MVSIKKWTAGTLAGLLVMAFTGVASAQEQNIPCYKTNDLKQTLKQETGDIPTNYKGEDKNFNYQIYADPNDGSWSITGQFKDVQALGLSADVAVSCRFGSFSDGFPHQVVNEPWFKESFKNSAPAP